MRYTLLFLLLAACSPDWRTHEPALSHAPTDRDRYVSDLRACKDYVMGPKDSDALVGGFGLIGAAVEGATNPSAFDSPNTQVDRCMADKGYPVTKTAR